MNDCDARIKNCATANIELRAKLRKLEKANKNLTRKNSELQNQLAKEREKIRLYGIGRPNQHNNNSTSLIKIRPYQIQAVVENICDLPYNSVFKKSREGEIVLARHLYIYFLRMHTTLSLKKIGKEMQRDHSTILHSEQFVQDKLDKKTDEEFLQLYQMIENKISETISTGKFIRTRQKKFHDARERDVQRKGGDGHKRISKEAAD